MNKDITPSILRDWNACWLDSEIAEHFGNSSALTSRQIGEDDSVTLSDRIWVLTSLLARIDSPAIVAFAEGCDQRARGSAADAHALVAADLVASAIDDGDYAAVAAVAHAAAHFAATAAADYAAAVTDGAAYAAASASLRASIVDLLTRIEGAS